MAKSTKTAKPSKPRPDFPLYAHASGRWAQRIRGKIHYFGKWHDPHAAFEEYVERRDALFAGRQPRSKRQGFTVKDACDNYLHARKQKVESGELAAVTWGDYQLTAKRVADILGRDTLVEDLRGEDFDRLRAEFAKTCGLVGLRNKITHTRMIFNYAFKADLIERPVRFGANFSRPSAKAIRKQRTPRMFEAVEIRTMLDNAGPVLNRPATMKATIRPSPLFSSFAPWDDRIRVGG